MEPTLQSARLTTKSLRPDTALSQSRLVGVAQLTNRQQLHPDQSVVHTTQRLLQLFH